MPDRRRTIQLIHVAKGKLAIGEETYRVMLGNLTGKQSCTDMTDAELSMVFNHLRNVGFKPQPSLRNKRRQMLRDLWAQLAASGKVRVDTADALAQWAQRQGVGDIGSATDQQYSQLIEALKQWQSRV